MGARGAVVGEDVGDALSGQRLQPLLAYPMGGGSRRGGAAVGGGGDSGGGGSGGGIGGGQRPVDCRTTTTTSTTATATSCRGLWTLCERRLASSGHCGGGGGGGSGGGVVSAVEEIVLNTATARTPRDGRAQLAPLTLVPIKGRRRFHLVRDVTGQ